MTFNNLDLQEGEGTGVVLAVEQAEDDDLPFMDEEPTSLAWTYDIREVLA